MTHLQAVPALPEFQCLLCGSEAETYVDLCDRCADAVQATADRVAATLLPAALPAGGTVEHVPGQLELEALEAAVAAQDAGRRACPTCHGYGDTRVNGQPWARVRSATAGRKQGRAVTCPTCHGECWVRGVTEDPA